MKTSAYKNLLAIFQQHPRDWYTRDDLAAMLGHPHRVCMSDVFALHKLIRDGVIEERVRTAPYKRWFEYRRIEG